MKTTANKANLLALILMGTTAIAGCSSLTSPTSEYVKPGELCTDVSNLPDPNAPPKDQTVALRNSLSQYGYGGRREESPERLLLQADSYFEQKRYHDSARLYKKYLLTPDASSASPDLLGTIHYRVGFVAAKKTFYTEAKNEFTQALQFSPTNNEYLFAYAKACYDGGDFQTADQQFSALLLRDPAYPEAQRYYGLTLLEGSNRANALQPLISSVGALQAYALLTDKYYEVGELELAAQMESQTIQIAAQNAQPIPRFPHKEQLMANAQNATYAQTLNNMVATAPAAPQIAQTTPIVTSASPAPQPFVPEYSPSQSAPVAPHRTETSPAVPQYVAVQPKLEQTLNQTAPLESRSEPAAQPVKEPEPVVSQPEAIPAIPPVDPVAQERAQTEPFTPQPEPKQAPVRYAQISPVPVDSGEATRPATQGPAVEPNANDVQERLREFAEEETSEPIFGFAQRASLVEDDDDDWDDSAFATSGSANSGNMHDFNAQRQPPQPEIPMPPERVNATPERQLPVEQPPQQPPVVPTFLSQDEKRTSQASAEESFDLAATWTNALEAVARIADRAREYAQVHDESNVQHVDHEFVGYLASTPKRNVVRRASAEIVAESQGVTVRSLKESEGKELDGIKSEKAPISMIATELPPSPQKNAIQLSNGVETIEKPEPIATPEKHAVKAGAHVGAGNPGLFVATAARKRVGEQIVFRPGSIETEENVDQSVPDEIAVKIVQRSKRRAVAEQSTKKREAEWTRDEKILDLLVDNARFIEDVAYAYYEPLRDSVRKNWDESAFATSGNAARQESATGGFGDYMPPDDASVSAPFQTATYVAQLVEPQRPAPASLPQTSGIPDRVKYAPQTAVPAVQQTWQQAPLQRRQSTPEERLEAARRAGVQVVELSPDQYRQAVATGLGQPRR